MTLSSLNTSYVLCKNRKFYRHYNFIKKWPSFANSQFHEFKVQWRFFRVQWSEVTYGCRKYTTSPTLLHLPWQGGFCEGACPQSELVELRSQLLDLVCQLRLEETIGRDVITGRVYDVKRPENERHTVQSSYWCSVDTAESRWASLSSYCWTLRDRVIHSAYEIYPILSPPVWEPYQYSTAEVYKK